MKYILIAVAVLTVIVVITMVSAYKKNRKLKQLLKLDSPAKTPKSFQLQASRDGSCLA